MSLQHAARGLAGHERRAASRRDPRTNSAGFHHVL
jgi:hypothetical protein